MRRANNTGNIRKVTKTVNGQEYTYWEASVAVGRDDATGKIKRKYFSGKTQKEVATKMKEAQYNVDTDNYTDIPNINVTSWLTTWLEEYQKNTVKLLTLQTYRSRINNRIIPSLGGMKLKDLNTVILQKFCNSMTEDGYSAKYVIDVMAILQEALKQAVELRILNYNPCDAVKRPRKEKKEIKPLTEADITRLLAELKNEPLGDAIQVILFTGMRRGELLGLSWDEVDFSRGTITIKQQLQKGKEKGSGYYITAAKEDKVRTIMPAPYVMQLLLDRKKTQNQDRLKCGLFWKNTDNLVFTTQDGRHLCSDIVYERYKAIAERIGRGDTYLHTLRHTFAVNSLQEGDDVKTVQENLGHATAAFTLDVYGHVSDQMKKASADRMEKLIAKLS